MARTKQTARLCVQPMSNLNRPIHHLKKRSAKPAIRGRRRSKSSDSSSSSSSSSIDMTYQQFSIKFDNQR